MIELYDFQTELVDELRASFFDGSRASLLVSPTGSGKTCIFSFLAGRMSLNGIRLVILAHRKELIRQIRDTLGMFHVEHGTIAPGSPHERDKRVQVASVFTAARRLHQIIPPDHVIIDEAHHAITGSTWNKCLDEWRIHKPNMLMTGVTATPERLSGEGLGATFNRMILGPTTRELIDLGYLAEYDMYAPPQTLDTSEIRIKLGDYKQDDMEALVNRPSITGNAVAHYHKLLAGRPAIAFCISVKHAHAVAEEFQAAGYRAAAVDGVTMQQNERDNRIADFRAGRLSVLTSCDIVSEGFDVPGAHGAILLRPTESLGLYLQQCGRALRKEASKDKAIILDHVGNSARHGLPCWKREWSLHAKKRKGRKDPRDVAIRQCPKCGGVSAIHVMICRECGYQFETKARTIREIEGELEQIRNKERYELKRDRMSAKDFQSLVELGRQRGMNNPEGWAGHIMRAREAKKAQSPQRSFFHE